MGSINACVRYLYNEVESIHGTLNETYILCRVSLPATPWQLPLRCFWQHIQSFKNFRYRNGQIYGVEMQRSEADVVLCAFP